MSEFSTSYHIRIEDDREAKKRLRDAKLAGIIFGPGNGWLTFVPYAGSDAYRRESGLHFAEKLSRLTHCPTLYYSYAEDHGWAFALSRPDSQLMQHECWWNPSEPGNREQIDPITLDPFIADEQLEPLLHAFEQHAAAQAQPAYRFAELLGLPAYKWLSPELVQSHTEDYLIQGGRKVGAKPTNLAARLGLPPDRQIAVPHEYLGAREALDLILPFMVGFKSPWTLSMLAGYGRITSDGRCDWQARWINRESGDGVVVTLAGSGRLSFQANSTPRYMVGVLPKPLELPDRWLDSPEIAAIAARLPIPNGCIRPQLSLMTLRSWNDHVLGWELLFSPDKVASAPYVSWSVYIHAVSGDVLAEQLGRLKGYQVVPARQRILGGDWKDLDEV